MLKMIEQLSTTLEVRNEVQIPLGLERKFEADKEGAFQRSLKDLPFANRMRHFLLGDDFLFRKDLHRVDALRILFAHLEDFAERAASDELQELKVAWC